MVKYSLPPPISIYLKGIPSKPFSAINYQGKLFNCLTAFVALSETKINRRSRPFILVEGEFDLGRGIFESWIIRKYSRLLRNFKFSRRDLWPKVIRQFIFPNKYDICETFSDCAILCSKHILIYVWSWYELLALEVLKWNARAAIAPSGSCILVCRSPGNTSNCRLAVARVSLCLYRHKWMRRSVIRGVR